MPTAVAALPLPTKAADFPLPADGATAAASGFDFAALLLGQLTSEAGLAAVVAAADEAATTPADAATNAPFDPALLLASLGLTPPPQLPGRPAESGTAPLTASLPALAGAASASAAAGEATAQEAAQASLPAAGTAELVAAAGDSSSAGPLLTAQSADGSPAKLAGFEQKLAEALPGSGEIQPGAQPTANVAMTGNHPATQQRAESEQLHLATPVKDQAWSAELGQKVVWLANQDRQSAQLTLNPPQLGPIEISLDVKNDQATAVFASANAEVREAIETALPRLREMLAGVGVELGQTHVGAESFRQADQGDGNGRGEGRQGRNGPADSAAFGRGEALPGTGSRRGNSLVDIFA